MKQISEWNGKDYVPQDLYAPDLNLIPDELVSAMTPVGDLPQSHSLITASRNGYVRSILRWSLDRLVQEAQFGRGVKEDWDFQTSAQLCLDQKSDVLLFTQKGNYLRFPNSDLLPSLVQGIKLDEGEHVVGLVVDDQSESEVLMMDAEGKGARRALGSFTSRSIGLKPQPACTAKDVLGVRLVGEYDQVIALLQNGRLAILDADEAPLINRARPLAALPDITTQVRAFTSARSF